MSELNTFWLTFTLNFFFFELLDPQFIQIILIIGYKKPSCFFQFLGEGGRIASTLSNLPTFHQVDECNSEILPCFQDIPFISFAARFFQPIERYKTLCPRCTFLVALPGYNLWRIHRSYLTLQHWLLWWCGVVTLPSPPICIYLYWY